MSPTPDRGVRSLWVTNDFPPRSGGIEQMLSRLVGTLPPEDVRVLASPWEGDAAHDAGLAHRVDRVARRPLLPTPGLLRTVRRAAAEHRADVVVFGSAWPLAELAAHLDVPTLGITHGREAGMVRWGFRPAISRLARGCDAMTLLSDYTAARLAPVLDRRTAVHRLPGGVDTVAFHPDGPDMRGRLDLDETTPVVVCVSRLVRRKGQDQLVRIWPEVRRRLGDRAPVLVLVGTGPLAEELADAAGPLLGDGVRLTGEVPWEDLAAWYRTGDVFAMPCRTRLGGMDVEGLGLVFLEAQACGVPVVVGDSGGAPETVRDGETGVVVDGTDDADVTAALVALLADEGRRRAMGAAARRHAVERWDWSVLGRRLATILERTAGR